MCCISLTLSVVLAEFILLPNFSGHNTLYRLLEASQELTVLHCLLLTPAVFLLLFPFSPIFSNNFWLYSPTFCTCSRFCLPLFLCLYPSHLGLFLDLLSYPGLGCLILPPCILHCYFQPSILSVLLFLCMILLHILHSLTTHFPLDALHSSLTAFPLLKRL